MDNTIYWYDYETFGTDPRRDRVVQFAGLRTDENLNVVGDPLVMYCRPADDVLPDPYACLVTGITPQKALKEGVGEAEFIAAIHAEFSRPGTCIAGYNNIRFDDEFTRNTLYRNFYNPYAHEWQNGNSRWDIIDMVRLTRALRPEGIRWPVDADRKPSIRLELLTAENGISHESAHDAMSDVHATIETAKLIRAKQPRLYDYIYSIRKKDAAGRLVDLRTRDALLHVSSKYSTERMAIAVVMPICRHPVNKNGVIVYDLATDPAWFIEADADEVAASIFTPAAELPEDIERVPLKVVHLNKCPVLAPLNTMDRAAADRLGIKLPLQLEHRDAILADIDALTVKTAQIFGHNAFLPVNDPDLMLYGGGFFSEADNARMQQVRNSPPEALAGLNIRFEDRRLPEMLLRYRARNYPGTLNADESELWQAHRAAFLTDPACGPRTINRVRDDIESLRNGPEITGEQLAVLDELAEYVDMLEISLH